MKNIPGSLPEVSIDRQRSESQLSETSKITTSYASVVGGVLSYWPDYSLWNQSFTSNIKNFNGAQKAVVISEGKGEKFPSEDLQTRRDEVRQMVADGRPADGIPIYRGKKLDGDPVIFLKQHYHRYLSTTLTQSTLYCHDLADIDNRLLTALRDACREGSLPLGTKRDFSDALIAGYFNDGPRTEYKVSAILRSRAIRAEDPSSEFSNLNLQIRRDEIRRMVADGRPADGIPIYRGRRAGDGSPISFLERHYARYLSESVVPTMFMHDLRVIDTTLAGAVENESRGRSLPLGTKSDLLTLLAEGHFTDGLNTRKRVRETLRHRNKM